MRVALVLLCVLLSTGCNQNLEVVKSGERLEDAPRPVVDPNARPLAAPAGAEPAGMESAGMQEAPKVPPFAKAYFMHMWVEALYSVPQNKNPNPKWSSPLKDPEKGRVWCTDCHVSGQVNFEKIPKNRLPINDQLEKDKKFMVELMQKWVARLNSDQYHARDKLKQPVTCLTCHATNPAATE